MNPETKKIIILTVFIVLFESIFILVEWIVGLISWEPGIPILVFFVTLSYGSTVLEMYLKGSGKKRKIKIIIAFLIFSGVAISIPIILFLLYQVGAIELTIFNFVYLFGVIIMIGVLLSQQR